MPVVNFTINKSVNVVGSRNVIVIGSPIAPPAGGDKPVAISGEEEKGEEGRKRGNEVSRFFFLWWSGVER